MSDAGYGSSSIARKLMMALIMTILVLGLAEGVLRLTVPHDDLLFSWERPTNLIQLQGDGRVGPRPNAADTIYDGDRGWTYTTNSQGFREDTDTTPEAPPGAWRILALGDSFFFGINAMQDKTLPAQLEPLLSEGWGRPVEVVNIGVPGASAFDLLTYWRRYAPIYEYHGLLLGNPHTHLNKRADVEKRRAWYEDVRGPPPVDLRLYMVLRHLWAPWAFPSYGSADSKGDESGHLDDLVRIAQDASEQGKPVWFVDWPTRWETIRPDAPEESGAWLGALRPYIVVTVRHQLAERSCWGYDDTGHPSEAGYRAAAELIAETLVGQKTGQVNASLPRCSQVPGDGPGKEGSAPVPEGPNLMERQRQQRGRPHQPGPPAGP